MNPRIFKISAVFAMLSLVTLKVLAFTPEEGTNALTNVFKEVVKTESLFNVCDQKFPKTSATNRKVLQSWKTRNNLQDYERVMASMLAKSAEFKTQIEKINAIYTKRGNDIATPSLQSVCQDLSEIYKDPKYYLIPKKFAADLVITANLAKALDQKTNANTSTPNASVSNTPTPSASTNKPTPGRYSCIRTNTEFTKWAKDPKNPKSSIRQRFDVELFSNNEYVIQDENPQILRIKNVYDDILKIPNYLGTYAVREGRIAWQSGGFLDNRYGYYFISDKDSVNDKRKRMGGSLGGTFDNDTGKLTLRWENIGFSYDLTTCQRTGATQGKNATQIMSEGDRFESYLNPENVKAQTPRGNGNLNGLYMASKTGKNYERTAFFFPNGLKNADGFKQSRWGFDQLDCARVPLPLNVTPLKRSLCDPYSIQGNTVTFNDETYSFNKTSNTTFRMDGDDFKAVPPNPQQPIDAKLKYTSSSVSGSSGFYHEETLLLTKDGRFKFSTKGSSASFFTTGYDTTTVTSSQRDRMHGTYKFFPYSIELTYPSGLKLRYSFYRHVLLDGSKFDGSYVLTTKTFLSER